MPAGVKQTDAAGWLLIGVPRAAGVRNETKPDGLKEEATRKKRVKNKKKIRQNSRGRNPGEFIRTMLAQSVNKGHSYCDVTHQFFFHSEPQRLVLKQSAAPTGVLGLVPN